jgi:putative chitobiose transport system permease protein
MTSAAARPARTHAWWTPHAFLLPAAILLVSFVGLAFFQVIYFSFTRYTAFTGPEWIGLDNYQRLLGSGVFWKCLLNSALYLLVTPALIVLSLAAALLVQASLRGTSWLRLALFLPVVTPTIVAALAWRLLLSRDGVANAALGVVAAGPVNWLTHEPWTLLSPMLVTLWKGFGFYMMIFLAGLIAVPRELIEAARIDGASRLRVLWHVTLPSLWPVVTLVAIVSSISALKVFDELFVTVKGVPIEQQTAVPFVYATAFEVGDFGLASAAGIVLFVIILALSVVNLRLSARRSAAGAPA